MGIWAKLNNMHFRHGILISIIACFIASVFFPGVGPNSIIETLLIFIGILFGIIVGFFISDLYSRFQAIKENAAIDSSGMATYYSFAQIFASKRNKKWLEKQRDMINNYIRKFMPLPWGRYDETEPEFSEILNSLKEVEYKTDKENETYSNMLAILSGISDAREKLVINGKDHLTTGEWGITLSLAILLLFSLFYVKTLDIVSVIFTWFLSASIIMLLFVIRDLDNLKFGENSVSVEPYERVFDAIDKPRYYNQKKYI